MGNAVWVVDRSGNEKSAFIAHVFRIIIWMFSIVRKVLFLRETFLGILAIVYSGTDFCQSTFVSSMLLFFGIKDEYFLSKKEIRDATMIL